MNSESPGGELEEQALRNQALQAGSGGTGEPDAVLFGDGCACSVLGNEAPVPARGVGAALLALVGGLFARRRRGGKPS